jgi:RecJ-like exonuclease
VTETKTCFRCGGTGRGKLHGTLTPLISPKIGSSPAREIINFCSSCHGTGWITLSHKCKVCDGKGYIEEDNSFGRRTGDQEKVIYIPMKLISNTIKDPDIVIKGLHNEFKALKFYPSLPDEAKYLVAVYREQDGEYIVIKAYCTSNINKVKGEIIFRKT